MSGELPSRAKAVVVGAGIVGNSLAHHLARLGWRDLVLLDKGPLPNPGGSTGHASNFIFPVDHSREMTALTLDSMRQYHELGVYTTSGGIEVARTEERMQELRRRMSSAQSWGIEGVSLITPAQVKELVPFIDESIILGGFHTEGVGVVDSVRAGTLMRERAQADGALAVSANTEVLGIDVEHGRIARVRTTRGDIETEILVIACGVWSPKLARMAGASIPLTPAVHQMIDIGPVPRFAGTTKLIEYPIVRDMDTNMYERQDGTGLEIGSYAHRPILHDPEDLPSVEEAALSPTEFPFTEDDFTEQMEHALELMPEIVGDESVGVKYAINGILSLTPDGVPILGETPEVKGLWAASAVWVKEGPGVGRALAEWMVHGHSEIDLHGADVARFHDCQRTLAHVKARASEGFNKTYGIVHPSEQWASNRNVRLSPFHAREQELGAVFYEVAGWERPQWYESNAGLVSEYGVEPRAAEWDARWWSPIINAEHLAMRERAGIFDLSAFCIFDVTGPGALDAVQRIAMRQCNVAVGRVVYTPILSPAGGFKADLTIMRLAEDRFRVVTGGAHGMGDIKWFRDHLPADGSAQISDLTSAWTTIGLWGPRARDILSSVTARRRLQRGLPLRHRAGHRDRPAAGAGLADLLRGRPRLGAVRPDRAGRPAVGPPLGGRPAAPPGGGRDRRVRNDRPAREGLPGVRGRARRRVRRRRGGNGLGQGEGPGLRRQGGARRPARRRPCGGHVHAHGRRPCRRDRDEALHARPRARAVARRRAAGRREGPPLVRHQRGRRPVGRQVPADELPAARAREGGREAAGRVPRPPLPGDRRRGRLDPDLRPRERPGPLVRILCCVKRVPITGGRIVLTPDAQGIEERHLGHTISPHEECGVEEAVRLVEQHGGEVVVLALGPAEAEEQLRECLAMGADAAVLLQTGGAEPDPQATAAAIVDHVRADGAPFDLIVFGNESGDAGNYQVGIRVAHALGLPAVTGLKGMSVDGGTLRAEQEVAGGRDVYLVPLPAVATVKEGLNLPRYPSVPAKLRARKKPVAQHAPSLAGPQLEKRRLLLPEGQGGQAQILGNGPEAAPALVELLQSLGVA